MNAVRALTVGMSRELRARTGLLLLGFLALPPLLIERSRDGWDMFLVSTLLPAWALALASRGPVDTDLLWAGLGRRGWQLSGRLLVQILALALVAQAPLWGDAVVPDWWPFALAAAFGCAQLGRSAFGPAGVAVGLLAGALVLGPWLGVAFLLLPAEDFDRVGPHVLLGVLAPLSLFAALYLEARGGAGAMLRMRAWQRRFSLGTAAVAVGGSTAMVLVAIATGSLSQVGDPLAGPSLRLWTSPLAPWSLALVPGPGGGLRPYPSPWVLAAADGPEASWVLLLRSPLDGRTRLVAALGGGRELVCEDLDPGFALAFQLDLPTWSPGGEAFRLHHQAGWVWADAAGCHSGLAPADLAFGLPALGDEVWVADCGVQPRLLRAGRLGVEEVGPLGQASPGACPSLLPVPGGGVWSWEGGQRRAWTAAGEPWRLPGRTWPVGERLARSRSGTVFEVGGRRAWRLPADAFGLQAARVDADGSLWVWLDRGQELRIAPAGGG